MNALERAIEIIGGQTALASALGDPIKQGHVWYWLKQKGGEVPAEHCLAIEQATGVSRHDLRPDVFGPAPAEPAPVEQRVA
jgi:DNA-binding transcriptional regulator YdaS (Cro superfamily)